MTSKSTSNQAKGVARQFASTARLFSADAFARLQAAHVGVVGLGGVGSWAAEALARSGVGHLTLIDMDHVAESNLNRQVQALGSTLGQAKAEALAARIKDISAGCRARIIDDFVTPENINAIFSGPGAEVGFWIDATDDLKAKRAMIMWMAEKRRLKQLIVSGGAGGKTDPTRIELGDLSESSQDALLSTLRYDLRKHHGFPRQGKMKIQSAFSRQPISKTDDCDPQARLACAGYGSLVTVTAAMGLACAHWVMQQITKD